VIVGGEGGGKWLGGIDRQLSSARFVLPAVAARGAIFSARTSDLLGSGSTPLTAKVGGLQLGSLIAAAVSLSAATVAALSLQRLHQRDLPLSAPPQQVDA
jgi:hypothetical protein